MTKTNKNILYCENDLKQNSKIYRLHDSVWAQLVSLVLIEEFVHRQHLKGTTKCCRHYLERHYIIDWLISIVIINYAAHALHHGS